MIVCVCNGYSDKDIKRITQEGGVNTSEDVYAALGGTFCCGSCRCFADQLVEDNLAPASAGILLAAE